MYIPVLQQLTEMTLIDGNYIAYVLYIQKKKMATLINLYAATQNKLSHSL